MNNNKLIISSAGSGKTTFLVNKALELEHGNNILITTYTNENESEIKSKILNKRNIIPENITIQCWFSFLLMHGVKPYQGAMNSILFDQDIKGMCFSEGKSAPKYDNNGKPLFLKGGSRQYYGEKDFTEYYFTKNWKIYSDKLSKFVVTCDKKVTGDVISRLSKIYTHIYIDEVQDLAGYDLEFIKLLLKSDIQVLMVGDPRQVTYLTHHSTKYKKYQDGKIKDFLINECKRLIDNNTIDNITLRKSHRNNLDICEYSSKLFPELTKSEPCNCEGCRNNRTDHEGVFLVRRKDIGSYMEKFSPVQLVWSKQTIVIESYHHMTFGCSKGKTFDRVIIYPTEAIKKWIRDNNYKFTNSNGNQLKNVKEKFYVALTRAKYSVAIVYDYKDEDYFEIIKKYSE